jgi:hypothetical protein
MCVGCWGFSLSEKASILELKGFSYLDFLAAEEVIDSSKVWEAATACRSSFRLKAIAAG